MRVLVALILCVAGCAPIAVLRPPDPVRGQVFTVGGSVFPNPYGHGQYPVWAVPYLGYAGGDGTWEFNFSIQWSIRVGGKLKLAPGLSLDGGVSFLPESDAWFGDVDLGLILGMDGFYLSPRLHALGNRDQYRSRTDLAFQVSLGYWGEGWAVEVGYGPCGYCQMGWDYSRLHQGPYVALGLTFGISP